MATRLRIPPVLALLAVSAAMGTPSEAGAATVVNGGFESGTLAGWRLHRVTGAGNWFAYSGTDAPIGQRRKPTPADPVQAPPEGRHAAISDQANPDTLILYQDVVLEAGLEHRLSLLAYYDSYDPIAVPSPDTLSVDDAVLGKQRNQQFRIDVMKPGAPLESVDPADVLRTLFATGPGDPVSIGPTRLSANLSAFAGQTVRLRIANAVHEEVFNAGVDAVSIATTRPGQSPSHGRGSRRDPILFSFDGVRTNRRLGVATLRLRVSGAGLVRARATSTRAARSSGAGLPRKPIEPITVAVARAKTVAIHLRPTPAARAVLRWQRRLRTEVSVTFWPLGGVAETATVPVVLKLHR
jgi:hypothetical protein